MAFVPECSLSVRCVAGPKQARGVGGHRARQTHRCLPGVHSRQETDNQGRERPWDRRAGGLAFRGGDPRAPRGPSGCRSEAGGRDVCAHGPRAGLHVFAVCLFFADVLHFPTKQYRRQAIIIAFNLMTVRSQCFCVVGCRRNGRPFPLSGGLAGNTGLRFLSSLQTWNRAKAKAQQGSKAGRV